MSIERDYKLTKLRNFITDLFVIIGTLCIVTGFAKHILWIGVIMIPIAIWMAVREIEIESPDK